MKTLTCRELGGMCDEPLMAATQDEMMSKGMAHLEAAHPEMAATVKAAPKDDPMMVSWRKSFDAAWAAAPES